MQLVSTFLQLPAVAVVKHDLEPTTAQPYAHGLAYTRQHSCYTTVDTSTAAMPVTEDPSDLTLDDLETLLKDDHSVKLAGIDVDGILRGKLVSKKKFLSVAKDGFGFCSVIFGWDMHDQTYFRELKISNAENGYRDIVAHIDLSSFRRIPWENNIPFFLVSFREPEGNSLSACPRSLLERTSKKIEDAGMGALAGGTLCRSRLPPPLRNIRG